MWKKKERNETQKIPEDVSFSPLQKITFPAAHIKYRKGLPTVALDIVLGGP